MRLVTTILAGALVLGAAAFGCSSDSDDDGTSGAGGSTGATGGKGGTGGSSAGTGGGAAIDCTTAAGVTECNRIEGEMNVCTAVSSCSCDHCTCELQDCQASTACVALLQCALRTGCCPSYDATCAGDAGTSLCTDPSQCGDEVSAATADGSLQAAVVVGQCLLTNNCPTTCP